MVSSVIDQTIFDENLHEGLRILARIIARDFIAKNVPSGNGKVTEQKEI